MAMMIQARHSFPIKVCGSCAGARQSVGARRVVAGAYVPRGRHGHIRPYVGRMPRRWKRVGSVWNVFIHHLPNVDKNAFQGRVGTIRVDHLVLPRLSQGWRWLTYTCMHTYINTYIKLHVNAEIVPNVFLMCFYCVPTLFLIYQTPLQRRDSC